MYIYVCVCVCVCAFYGERTPNFVTSCYLVL